MAEGFDPLRSDEDVEEILRLAIRSGTLDGGSLRDRLQASASELGISPESLERAEKEWSARKRSEEETLSEAQDRRQFKRLQFGEFVTHLGSYLAVNAFLAWIDLGKDGKPDWFLWPLFGWGIAIVIHLFSLLGTDKDTEREFQRWRKKRRKGQA